MASDISLRNALFDRLRSVVDQLFCLFQAQAGDLFDQLDNDLKFRR